MTCDEHGGHFAPMHNLADLKIAFLALTLGQGGAERQLYYMLKALRAERANVRVLSLTKAGFWHAPIEALGVPVTWVGRSQSRLVRMTHILQELRRDRPHILQSQHFFVNLYAVLVARFLDILEIGAIRGDGVSGVDQVGKLASNLSIRSPRIIAANSRNAIQNVKAQGVSPDKLFLLPNVVDTELFLNGHRKTDDCIRLISVARLVEPKRIDRFLNVLHHLVSKNEVAVKGVIVGDGVLWSMLQERAAILGLMPEHVSFKGAVDDVTPYYREADVFVLTSDWEGTPNVVLEAMASGLPVVATNVGGVADLVQDGESGYLVPPGDEAAMLERLQRLVTDAPLRKKMGARGREHVLAHYSLQALPRYLADLYERTLIGNLNRIEHHV